LLNFYIDKWYERSTSMQVGGKRKLKQEICRPLASANANHCVTLDPINWH